MISIEFLRVIMFMLASFPTVHCHLSFQFGLIAERQAPTGLAWGCCVNIAPDLYASMLSLSLSVCKLPATTQAVEVISSSFMLQIAEGSRRSG
jgi:hypothetical protein